MIVVVGATSYLGARVIRFLVDSGHEIVPISRDPDLSTIVLGSDLPRAVRLDDAPRALKGRQISAVVNLAYVKNMRDPRLYALTTSLIDGVVDLAAEVGCDRIIHMSTMAVFGYDLARDQATRSVRWYPSDAYIEGKILAENRLIARTEGTGIVPIVLRLGNVIGAGSPAWMAEICQRMLECRPVGYIGRDGFCNATHPRNVGSYVEQLVRCSDATLRAAGTFHHLAELANERWSDVIEAVSASTGLSAIRVAGDGGNGGRGGARARGLGMLRTFVRGRGGSYLRAAVGVAPSWAGELASQEAERMWIRSVGARLLDTPADARDQQVLAILTCARRFVPRVLPNWTAPVSFSEALAEISDWAASAGYRRLGPTHG